MTPKAYTPKSPSGLLDEDITKGKDHEALEGPMTRGRLKQAQHVIETRLVICIAVIDDD